MKEVVCERRFFSLLDGHKWKKMFRDDAPKEITACLVEYRKCQRCGAWQKKTYSNSALAILPLVSTEIIMEKDLPENWKYGRNETKMKDADLKVTKERFNNDLMKIYMESTISMRDLGFREIFDFVNKAGFVLIDKTALEIRYREFTTMPSPKLNMSKAEIIKEILGE